MWADNDSVEPGRLLWRSRLEDEPYVTHKAEEVWAGHPRAKQIGDDHDPPRSSF
jgi:hypothetical protein